MSEVTEVVIALLMLVNGEMKEARIQTGYAECIKGRVIPRLLLTCVLCMGV